MIVMGVVPRGVVSKVEAGILFMEEGDRAVLSFPVLEPLTLPGRV